MKKKQTVRYYCIDLLWGKKLYRPLRFVLVSYADTQAILVSTNLEFSAEQIIRLYGLRQKIEVSIFSIKQVLHGFSSHFWSKSMPALNRYQKKNADDPLNKIEDENDRKNIINALKATESFVFFSCVATGILQMLAVFFHDILNPRCLRWLRTYSSNISSKATIAQYLRKSLFLSFAFTPCCHVMVIICNAQLSDVDDNKNSSA